MNDIRKKQLKRVLAVLLAVVLVISLGYFGARDSRLHAQEEFDYYEADNESEELEEADDYETDEGAIELFFDEEEPEELYEEPADYSEEISADTDTASEADEEAAASEEMDSDPGQIEESVGDLDDEEASAEEIEGNDEDTQVSDDTQDEEASAEEDVPAFDAEQAYADYQSMSLEELNAYLAGLSEEELAALEAFAASLDGEEDELEENAEQFIVVFVDWDDTQLNTQRVADGGNAVPPADPSREGYVFAGWGKKLSGIKEDTEFKAEYITVEEAEAAGETETVSFAEAYAGYALLDEAEQAEYLAALDEARRVAFELYVSERQAAEAKTAENQKIDEYLAGRPAVEFTETCENGLVVHVVAGEGALPEGAYMVLEPVIDGSRRGVDITFFDKDGTAIDPDMDYEFIAELLR